METVWPAVVRTSCTSPGAGVRSGSGVAGAAVGAGAGVVSGAGVEGAAVAGVSVAGVGVVVGPGVGVAFSRERPRGAAGTTAAVVAGVRTGVKIAALSAGLG